MKTVIVIGDVILDIYQHGNVKRISPEAPVPIVSDVKTEYIAGGAANVAINLASLNIDTCIYGICGNDVPCMKLRNILAKYNKLYTRLTGRNHYNTITKTRIIANNQHMLRIDNDCDFSDESESFCNKTVNFINNLKPDIVIISDYNKGTVHEPYHLISQIGAMVFVDPKKSFNNYNGAFLIKPNEKEFRQFVGDYDNIDELVRLAKNSLITNNIKNMLVTLGSNGMVLITKDDYHTIGSSAQQVSDVTGAGDTVLAAMVYEFRRSGSLIKAAEFANYMAGIAVSKIGNYIINNSDVRSYQKKIVFTNGCFDILHCGHIEYLKKSRELGDYLIVGINSDDSVKKLKGPDRPANDQKSRQRALEALPFVDEVVIFDEISSYNTIKDIKPNIITKGGDYTFDTVVGNDLAEVVIIPFVDGYSTTSIINKL